MGKSTPVFDPWNDPDFLELDRDGKLLFLYLATCPAPGPSGIFIKAFRTIEYHTSIEREVIEDYLRNGKIKNVIYDLSTSTVFVKNRLRYDLARGGNASWRVPPIIGDHKLTWRAKNLWRAFSQHYEQFAGQHSKLQLYLEKILGEDDRIESIPGALFETEKENVVLSPVEPDYEQQIQEFLNRYPSELDPPDCEKVLRVYRYLSTHKKTGNPIKAERRLEILKYLSKVAALQVAVACNSFLKVDGPAKKLPFAYLKAILNKSAASWFIEYRNEKEKRGGLNLE